MKRILFVATLTLLAGCATVRVATEEGHVGTRAEAVSTVLRPSVPEGLSGITWLSGNTYLAVDDSGGFLYPLSVPLDSVRERPLSCTVGEKVHLEGVVDGEGIAYDPLRGTVWVSDEDGPRITEHDFRTGRKLSELVLPPELKTCRPNLSLESLTISPNGLTLWTANEEALPADGPRSTTEKGTVVRLYRYVRASADAPWTADGVFLYRTARIGGRLFKDVSCSGVSDLCALGNGRLLVLERELSIKKFKLPTFRMRLYEVDFAKTDADGVVGKRLLLGLNTGIEMYEGICLGPRLSDGSRHLMLISDGDGAAAETVLSLRLF